MPNRTRDHRHLERLRNGESVPESDQAQRSYPLPWTSLAGVLDLPAPYTALYVRPYSGRSNSARRPLPGGSGPGISVYSSFRDQRVSQFDFRPSKIFRWADPDSRQPRPVQCLQLERSAGARAIRRDVAAADADHRRTADEAGVQLDFDVPAFETAYSCNRGIGEQPVSFTDRWRAFRLVCATEKRASARSHRSQWIGRSSCCYTTMLLRHASTAVSAP